METQSKVFSYKGNLITFSNDGTVMVNATEMAKPFEKSATHWLRNQSTQEFISTYAELRNCNSTDLVKVTHGDNGGTWMHEDVALEFARWLSPAFAIWCNGSRRRERTSRSGESTSAGDHRTPTGGNHQVGPEGVLLRHHLAIGEHHDQHAGGQADRHGRREAPQEAEGGGCHLPPVRPMDAPRSVLHLGNARHPHADLHPKRRLHGNQHLHRVDGERAQVHHRAARERMERAQGGEANQR